MIPLYIYLGAVFALSLAAFIAYGADKSKARRGAWRIPEKVLLGLSFFGGAAGGLCGMLLFRHMPRHWDFWAVNVLGLLWQTAAAVSICLFA